MTDPGFREHHKFRPINDDIVRMKVTRITHIRLVQFSFWHSARSALRPFGIAPNDVRHSARSTSFSPFGIASRSHVNGWAPVVMQTSTSIFLDYLKQYRPAILFIVQLKFFFGSHFHIIIYTVVYLY